MYPNLKQVTIRPAAYGKARENKIPFVMFLTPKVFLCLFGRDSVTFQAPVAYRDTTYLYTYMHQEMHND